MINYRYQLTQPRKIVKKIFDENIKGKVIVKPTYFSICAADQRYFQGKRKIDILDKKLPLSLIHEAVGEVIVDETNTFKPRDKVILLPNIINEEKYENYNPNNLFMSSSADGFMQEKIIINPNQLINFKNKNEQIMVFSELLSVAIHAINTIDNHLKKAKTVGIWGDGNLGYLLHLYLKHKYKNLNVIIFGTNQEKLSMFGMTDKRINILNNKIMNVDIAFEAVGGENSQNAINQIIDYINPTGIICLLGVSENLQPINTRMILEKGITLIGRSRSLKKDFIEAIRFLEKPENKEPINKVIAKVFIVRNIHDIVDAFDFDYTNYWKTLIKWEM